MWMDRDVRQLGQLRRGINLMWHPYAAAAKHRVDFNVGKLAETSSSSSLGQYNLHLQTMQVCVLRVCVSVCKTYN